MRDSLFGLLRMSLGCRRMSEGLYVGLSVARQQCLCGRKNPHISAAV